MGMSTNGSTSLTEQLMQVQETDHSILDVTEANKLPSCFYKRQGLLMR